MLSWRINQSGEPHAASLVADVSKHDCLRSVRCTEHTDNHQSRPMSFARTTNCVADTCGDAATAVAFLKHWLCEVIDHRPRASHGIV